MTDDAALVARALQGDLVAYGELIGRYQFDALRVAAAIGGPAVAEDAAQDAFVRAFKALPRFSPSRPFRPWLMAIVANTARNQRRSRRRWARAATLDATLYDVVSSTTATPEDTAIQGERIRSLLVAVDRLPRGQRDVISCRYLMDFTEAETAQLLGIPRGTVKSRLARALARLEVTMRKEVQHD